jgi:tetratricopeptide (TPR) repeat protein
MKTSSCSAAIALAAALALVSGCSAGNADRDTDARAAAQSNPPAIVDLSPVGATKLDGLGDHSMSVSTRNPEAQEWFNQGLALTYGFNHDAAGRSFIRATQLDPECAMCWWGAALVLGPHVNAAMDPEITAVAWDRIQRAQAAAAKAPEREQAYIRALSTRYSEQPLEDRRPLDEAYAEAMADLVKAYPDDLDAATLYAESLMNLQPWDYWDAEGEPKGNTEVFVSTLESVIERNDEHPGALHLYIHAVEASNEPERGVAAADRLRELVPAAGHLVHMPAHIYARVGRYHDAVIANQKAIAADDDYLAACRPAPGVYPLGYVPHNHHFLWFAATMGGEAEIAMDAAQGTAERTSDPELMRMPGFEAMQNFALTPLFSMVRFARWDEIVASPKPADDLPYMQAMWHYAQGIAAVRQQRLDEARSHHESVAAATKDPAIEQMMTWGRYSLVHGVKIGERVLAAEIAAANGDLDAAVAALREAVPIEDGLPYDEPPGWHLPVRHTLGAVLLQKGEFADAEKVYREELRRNPENGWSLYGLSEALAAQDRDEEAAEVHERFERAWANADVTLSASLL